MIVRELITLLGFKVDDTGQKEYNKDIDETKGKQQSLTASILKANLIGKAAGAVLGGAFSFIKDSVIGTTAEIERYKVALGTMMGDQEKANKIIHDLDYSDTSDFYGTAAAVGGLKAMVTMGMEAQKASDILQKIGDVAQGDGAAFQSLSQNMGQVFAKGKADAMDLKQFVAQGFDVSGEVAALDMAKQMGVNVTAIDRQSAAFQAQRKAVEKAGISYEQTEAALMSITGAGGKYEGMLEKQSNTLGGIINKFKSLKAATAEAIGTGVSEELKDLLKYILDIGKKGQDVFVNGMVRVIKEVIHWIYQAIITVKLIGYALEDLGINFEPLIVFVKSLADSFENTMLGILPFLEKIGVLLLAVGNNIARFLTPIIKEVGEIARDVFGTLAQWLDPVIKLVQASSGTFEVLGNIIAKLLRPALAVAVGIKGITLAIAGIKAVTGGITAVSTAFKLLTGSMSVMKAAAEGNKLAMIMLDAQMLKSKAITLAKTAAEKIAALATKAWSVVQMAFNAVMSANPIALIILAVIALVAAAILLIKNWDKVKAFFIAFGKKIAEIFTVLVAKIKQMFSAVIQWIKNVWSKISDFFSSLWNGIVNVAMQIWDSLKTWFASFIEGIKAVWGVITDFFSDLWNGIVDATRFLWEPLVEWFTGLIDGIKTVWNGITGFFSGLWEAIMNGPAAAIEYIRTAFTSLFSGIEEKLFGFINKVKEGWDKVTGFFGNAVTGVVNFFTGGDPEIEKTAPTKVNDMILTPEGQYQTSPDDYIMAMKNPMDLVDAVLRFLGQGLGGMPEPALAGAAGQGMMDAAMYQAAAAPTNYNNSTSSYSESFQAPITVNVNAASMSPQEAQAAVQRGVEDALKNAINSSRGNIPKPEVERY